LKSQELLEICEGILNERKINRRSPKKEETRLTKVIIKMINVKMKISKSEKNK